MKKILTTLFLFLLFLFPVLNAQFKTFSTSQYFTGNSWIIVEIEDIQIPVGEITAEYKLKDASGKIIQIWEHQPDFKTQIGLGRWYAKDRFEIKLPCMWFYRTGSWKIEGRFKGDFGDFNPTVYVFNFYTKRGSFFDEFFAPIYIYGAWKILIFTLTDINLSLPSIGILLTPIILIILLFIYLKIAKKSFIELIKGAKASIRKIKKEI